MSHENGFPINSQSFTWGIPFSAIKDQLASQPQLNPYPTGWANLRMRGNMQFGLQVSEIDIRAPFPERPVLQVHYHLAPLPPASEGEWHSAYVKILETHFGPAKKKDYYYNSNIYKGAISSAGVVFTCNWDTRDVHIGISVFGGTRKTEFGDHAATLYIQWKDEVSAAKSLVHESEQFVSKVLELSQSSGLHKFSLAHAQFPFFDFNNKKTDPRAPEYQHELRCARIALYKRNNFATPDQIANALAENEIALFHVAELHSTFIANKWDMTFVKDKEEAPPQFSEILPARGSGGRELDIKGWVARDTRESNKLLDAVQWIERLSGVKASMLQYYDD